MEKKRYVIICDDINKETGSIRSNEVCYKDTLEDAIECAKDCAEKQQYDRFNNYEFVVYDTEKEEFIETFKARTNFYYGEEE